jgi:chromosome segregation ATPase
MAPISDEEKSALQKDVAVLKRDSEQFEKVVDKIDNALSDLDKVGNNINNSMAVQEQRIEQQEDHAGRLYKLLDTRRAEMLEKLDGVEDKIESMAEANTNDHATVRGKIENVEKEINSLKNWKWMVVGMATTAGAIMSVLIPIIFKIVLALFS